MFTEDYLDSLPNEPILAISEVVNESLKVWEKIPHGKEGQEYDFFLEAFAIVQALSLKVNDLSVNIPELRGEPQEIVNQVCGFFTEIKSQIACHLVALKKAQFTNKYNAKFGNVFAYEFSEGDLRRVQGLVNSLRDLISESVLFDPDHKRRILLRLEKVQSEMHKKMSDLDRFWGLVGEAGIALGKFGDDAKPIVDRIREIAQIVWRTQARAEELPSDAPMELLTSKEEKV